MLPVESRKTHVLPVRAFGDCPENVFADRICRTNTFLFYLFFWLLSRKYPKEICPCDDFEPKADLRDHGIASGSGERGQRVLRNRGIAPAPGGEDDVVFGNTGLLRMTGGIARPGNAACPQAPGKTAACSAVRRLNPERGAARRSRGGKRRKSAGIPASSLHGRHRGAQTVGERTVCAVSVFQTCGRDAARGIVLRHVCPAPQSDGFAGRRVAAEALHGMGKAGKYRAAPAYFPKKREIRRRLRRRTMYKRSSFDTAMSYSRKAALASR